MTTIDTNRAHAEIVRHAREIAGAIWDDYYNGYDAEGSLAERLRQCAKWTNRGSDGDLTEDDRATLRVLADAAEAAEAN